MYRQRHSTCDKTVGLYSIRFVKGEKQDDFVGKCEQTLFNIVSMVTG